MAFTLEDKAKIRRHLGYPNVTAASIYSLGSVVPIETLFIVDAAMNRVLPEAEDDILRFVAVLDRLECLLVNDQDFMVADVVGDVTLSREAADRHREEYVHWGNVLADALGVPIHQFSRRYRTSVSAGSLRVRNS